MSILKRYAKRLSISVLAVCALCLVAPVALAQGQGAAAAAAPASVPENLMAAVKLPPLASLAEKVTLVSGKAELDPQTQMFMMLMLSQYGFPAFPGVSAQEGVTIFALLQGREQGSTEKQMPQIVAFAKVAPDSPIRNVLQTQGLQVLDREGWTLVAMDPSVFSAIKDFPQMAAIAASESHFDIEARFYPSSKVVKDGIAEMVKQSVENAESDDAADKDSVARLNGWLQFAFEVIDEIEWAAYGFSVDAQNVSAGVAVAAKDGTAIADFINAKNSGGKVEAGQFLPASAPIGYVANMNIEATVAYIKSLEQTASRMPDPKARALVQETLTEYVKLTAASDGGAAGIVTELNLETSKSKSQSVQTGKFELAQVDHFYEQFFGEIVPSFGALFGDEVAEEIKKNLNSEVKKSVAKVEGQDVNAFVFSIPNAENPLEKTTEESYYTVINGAILSAQTLEELTSLVAVYAAGKPVANNLADAFPLESGAWMKGAIDVKQLMQLNAQAAIESGEAGSAQWKAQLDALAIQPALFNVKTERKNAVFALTMPLDSAVNLIKLSMSMSEGVEEAEVIEVQVTPQS